MLAEIPRLGQQAPRVESLPPGRPHPLGDAALKLVAEAGIVLDAWQERVFRASLLRNGSKWAAMEVGLVLPRQNGKNVLLEARELAGLFVFGERLLIHSAHLAATSLEAFRRLSALIESNDWLMAEVKRVWRGAGKESIELKNGNRIEFKTRTGASGRGFSGDFVAFDEAMIFPDDSLGAIFPVISARPDPQMWYTGSAVDRLVHDNGLVLARVRERGLAGDDASLAYFEWSLGYGSPEEIPREVMLDDQAWAAANPALGIRISTDYIVKEQRSLPDRIFAVERLGVGDWPDIDADRAMIDLDQWEELKDPFSKMVDAPVFAFDVTPDRSRSSIAACGRREDGALHIELVEWRPGTGWLGSRLLELAGRYSNQSVICDGSGPAGSLIPELERAEMHVTAVTAREHARACGLIYDAVEDRTLRHLGQDPLDSAIKGAITRPLGEAWAWSRRNSAVDISPLVACTLALWGASTQPDTEVWADAW